MSSRGLPRRGPQIAHWSRIRPCLHSSARPTLCAAFWKENVNAEHIGRDLRLYAIFHTVHPGGRPDTIVRLEEAIGATACRFLHRRAERIESGDDLLEKLRRLAERHVPRRCRREQF